MSWSYPEQYKDSKFSIDQNAKMLSELVGELDDKVAKITLVDFLRNNLGMAVELMTGIILAPHQEITLRAFINRNYSMCVYGRGCGKSFIAAIFCIIQAILEPNSRIIIAGPTFRTSRFIFNEIEKILGSKGAVIARQAFGENKQKRNDIHSFTLDNGSSIAAIPLNGEKIRGFRASILLIDEYLLMSKEIIDTVLVPFLSAPQDIAERQIIIERERELEKQGILKDEHRHKFTEKTKMIALSSASFTFENLYVTYCDWIKKINNAKEEQDKCEPGTLAPKYFIGQMAWNAIPRHMINPSVIKEADSGGENNAIFQREYCALFSDGSDGYFSAKKMQACTYADGTEPTIQIKGNKDSKYIVALDPNASNSATSDDFGISVIELDEKGGGTLVHAYGEHGVDLSAHIKYFFYILTNFNVELIAIDNAGADTFISACNESRWFQGKGIELKCMDFDPAKDEPECIEEIKLAKRELNKTINKKVFKIVFSNNNWIRKSNEYLQGCIDYKKIWFASKAQARESAFNTMMHLNLNTELLSATLTDDKDEFSMDKFVEHVGFMIDLTKKQCAMIEVSTSARGGQTFDLPLHLARERGEARARRDNYTALLLGVWAMKTWYEIQNCHEAPPETFSPFILN